MNERVETAAGHRAACEESVRAERAIETFINMSINNITT
jgi:hypothetical protein